MLATISDRKIAVPLSGGSLIDYYKADLLWGQDYYAFGMAMPVRAFGIKGRYGFNGKENDNEVKGDGNQQDYGMRIYDTRIGKFLSVDPLTKDYPFYTPYQFSANDPINFIDLDGLERGSPPRPGGVRGSGTPRIVNYAEEAAFNTAIRLRRGAREQEIREEREQMEREVRQGTRERMVRFREGMRQYVNNALTSAQYSFGGGNSSVLIQKNQMNSNVFEKEVYNAMLKNPDYKNVIKQVTFAVEGSNGVTVRVRIDNVGVRKDGTLDLVEAKFSIYGITNRNVSQSLTLNQKEFFSMLISGNVASIKFIGGAVKESQIGALSGTVVTGKINSISIVGSTGGASPAAAANTNPPSAAATPKQLNEDNNNNSSTNP